MVQNANKIYALKVTDDKYFIYQGQSFDLSVVKLIEFTGATGQKTTSFGK